MGFSVADCRLITFPRIADSRGTLHFMEYGPHVPFPITRIYFVSQLAAGIERGHHAHREGESVLMAASGKIEVTVADGHAEQVVTLDSLDSGIYLPPGIWVSYRATSEGSVLVGLASSMFDESDYIRTQEDFIAWRRNLATSRRA